MNKTAHRLAIIGACSPLLLGTGFLFSVIRVSAALSGFDPAFDDNQAVRADLQNISNQVGATFNAMLLSIVLSLLMIGAFIAALVKFRYRRTWAFWFACIYGALLTAMFPVGTAIGVFLLIYALTHRAEFGVARLESGTQPSA